MNIYLCNEAYNAAMAQAAAPLILFVPGKNPKPAAEPHGAQLFRCLVEGIRRSGSDSFTSLSDHPEWFEVLAWNELFYESTRDIADELPWIDRLLKIDGPTQMDMREARAWKTRFAWILYNLGDRIPLLIPLIANPTIKSTILEIRRYFQDENEIGSRIRRLLQARLRSAFENGQRVLLIGHSMGSVIAFDALWELTHEHNFLKRIDLFVTMGSPLGLSFVQKRLLGAKQQGAQRYPANISHWCNISAMGELTALDREFADDFRKMKHLGLVEEIRDYYKGVYNYYRDDQGLNVHRSYGYLVNPISGKVVADWLEPFVKKLN
jgi:hypothetical protein